MVTPSSSDTGQSEASILFTDQSEASYGHPWSVSWEVVTLAPDWLVIVWCVVTDCELLVSNWLCLIVMVTLIISHHRGGGILHQELIHCQQVRSVIVCDIVRMMFAVFVTNPGSSPAIPGVTMTSVCSGIWSLMSYGHWCHETGDIGTPETARDMSLWC